MKISRKKLGAQVFSSTFFQRITHPYPSSFPSVSNQHPWWLPELRAFLKRLPVVCVFFCFLVWGGVVAGQIPIFHPFFFFGGGYGMGDGKVREANQYCHQLAGESWTRAKGYGRGFLKDLSLP